MRNLLWPDWPPHQTSLLMLREIMILFKDLLIAATEHYVHTVSMNSGKLVE